MPREVIMPALGMAQDSGTIVAWLKQPGAAVKRGDPLFEVETDKATMEVEAPADGYLADVQAGDGAVVPVGQVIARISEDAQDRGTASPADPEAQTQASGDAPDDLPQGAEVIMPALGMAQDTGQLVAWHKAPGDAVAARDILFEVETDKSTMEVEAGRDGFVAALLAQVGEDAPVGAVIAIISADRPEAPVQRSLADASPTPVQPLTTSAKPGSAAKTPRAEAGQAGPGGPAGAGGKTGQGAAATGQSDVTPPAPPTRHGTTAGAARILASPKARRLALQQGLDLSRLVAAGHPQPYHARDIEVLRSLPAVSDATAASAAARHLVAAAPDGLGSFIAWAAEEAGITDVGAILAGFAAASLGQDIVVAVTRFEREQHYRAGAILSRVNRTDGPPALRLRDLRGTAVRQVQMGAEDMPVLTLTGGTAGEDGAPLSITLECGADQLSPPAALALLSNFAGRIGDPLRHLL
ncbi:biotin/lipoyl-containing protein [Pseudooceanicola aestuarii]|uniref:biotin/lipoyl-containing protein n=1 Tax=Pseudooceanicola aestuarii TaxID=2697319 RepID=UPI0013D8882D|nr:biotin/lipoyl-containing protein [Pseudooceanicola aestuarii]